jgi:SpoVK/Ycf46/Vps4 family AAA+-type ATPase
LETANAIKHGRQDVVPMGYLVSGPVGTGKTFLVSCFANDIGIPMVMLKNFRSQWQGVTEGNLEKVLKILKAMTPVAVMIDEADAYLGDRNNQGDSGVSNRVFSMIATFMSNTEHRGKIIWFLMTARPDLMPIDFKRQGRAEEHIALFYPQTLEEKKELFAIMLKKTGIKNLTVDQIPEQVITDGKVFSGADIEAALTRAKFRAVSEGASEVTPEIIQKTFDDFLPPTYPEEVELMNYAAVLECTSKDLLPEKYRVLTRAEVVAKIKELKMYIE